jgi:signal transduction protein with GAF and PtsI domain
MKPEPTKLIFLATVGILMLFAFQLANTCPPSWTTQTEVLPKRVPESLVKPHLERATQRIESSTEENFQAIESLLDRARQNTRPFAKLALGWGSKWRIVSDAMPWSDGGKNELYLRSEFEANVLRGDDLRTAIEQCVSEYLARIQSVESNMLVELQADIRDYDRSISFAKLDSSQLQVIFDDALARAKAASQIDLQSTVSSQLVSIVVGEVLTQVAVRLGVSAGILGTGAAAGWVTLGVGVIVGIVIDQIVMTIWNRWADPEGKLVDSLNLKMTQIEHLICYGDVQTKGLLYHFREIASVRETLRKRAVYELFQLGEKSK